MRYLSSGEMDTTEEEHHRRTKRPKLFHVNDKKNKKNKKNTDEDDTEAYTEADTETDTDNEPEPPNLLHTSSPRHTTRSTSPPPFRHRPFQSTNDDWHHRVRNRDGNRVFANRRCLTRKRFCKWWADHHIASSAVEIVFTRSFTDKIRLCTVPKTGQLELRINDQDYLQHPATTLDEVMHEAIPYLTDIVMGRTCTGPNDAQWYKKARALGWTGVSRAKGQQCYAPHKYESIQCSVCGYGPEHGRYRLSKKTWGGPCRKCGGEIVVVERGVDTLE